MKTQESSFLANFGSFISTWGPRNFFLENPNLSLFSVYSLLFPCKILERTSQQIPRKTGYRRKDGRKNRWLPGKAWIHRTSSAWPGSHKDFSFKSLHNNRNNKYRNIMVFNETYYKLEKDTSYWCLKIFQTDPTWYVSNISHFVPIQVSKIRKLYQETFHKNFNRHISNCFKKAFPISLQDYQEWFQ